MTYHSRHRGNLRWIDWFYVTKWTTKISNGTRRANSVHTSSHSCVCGIHNCLNWMYHTFKGWGNYDTTWKRLPHYWPFDRRIHQWISFAKASDVQPFILWHHMMTSSNENIFRVTGHLCGEFTGPRWIPRTKASDAELWCFLWSASEKRLRKQWWGWWFDTSSRPLSRHCNEYETH